MRDQAVLPPRQEPASDGRDAPSVAETEACGMVHERVLGDGIGPRRPPICGRGRRTANLACAHTTARLVLRDLLLALAQGAGPERETCRDALARLSMIDLAIGELDHRRHAAETALWEAADPAAAEAARGAIAQTVSEHLRLADELNDIRSGALAAWRQLKTTS